MANLNLIQKGQQSDLDKLYSDHQVKMANSLREKLSLMQAADSDPYLRSVIKEKCKRDIKWFCNTWIVTYNPREPVNKLLPFVMYPRQEDMVDFLEECYVEKEWGSIVKCRYTGASYITLMWMLHKLMFERDFTGTLASNKADSVDKTNNSKSLFYKIMDMYKRLPEWLKTFDLSKAKTRMQLYNKELNSAIVGESGKDIGRGGRSSAALVDETAHIEADLDMVAALSENTDCAIFVSTPKGVANEFFRMTNSNAIKVFYYRWQSDPRRSVEWRIKQDLKLGEATAKQELDCDFYASTGESLIDPKWTSACINAHLAIPELLNNRDVQAGLDIAGSGKNETILAVRRGSVIDPLTVIKKDSVTQAVLEVNRLITTEFKPAPTILCFDADGIGNDIKGTLMNMEQIPEYYIEEFRGAGKTSTKYWDSHEQSSNEFLYNKRAEAWFTLRQRIKNTHDHINGIQQYEPHDMISLPEDELLRQDLSKPGWEYRGGKMLIMSKIEMRKKGLSSPDRADAIAYACYDAGIADYLRDI